MKSQLIDLAASILQETGQVPPLAALAAASGLSRATVYRALGSREALEEALRERGLAPPEGDAEVFAAVRAVLLEQGIEGFTLERVAQQAGVSVATLHRRFEGRDGLLFEFFDRLTPRAEAWRLAEEGAADAVLAAFARRLSAWLVEDGGLLLAVLSASPQTRRRLREARALGVGTQEALASWLSARGAAAGRPVAEPLAAARAFLGGVVGLSAGGPLSEAGAVWWARTVLHGLEIP